MQLSLTYSIFSVSFEYDLDLFQSSLVQIFLLKYSQSLHQTGETFLQPHKKTNQTLFQSNNNTKILVLFFEIQNEAYVVAFIILYIKYSLCLCVFVHV